MNIKQITQLKNHPRKGAEIRVDPIYQANHIQKIKDLLKDNPRDLAIFTVGINTGLRGSDLLRLRVGKVKYLKPGDDFVVKQRKTGKPVVIPWHKDAHKVVQRLLKTMDSPRDEDLLFQGKKTMGKEPMSITYLNMLVKGWCKAIRLRGNYGSHTLRKTLGRKLYDMGIAPAIISEILGHSSVEQTRVYLCLTNSDVKKAMQELEW